MWCPKCGAEYREGFFVCAGCECSLVEESPFGEESLPKERKISTVDWTLLTTVNTDIEAAALEALLEENGIPVLKKYIGAAEYMKIYMGMVTLGVKIYVPETRFHEAEDLISERLSVGRQINEDTVPVVMGDGNAEISGGKTFDNRNCLKRSAFSVPLALLLLFVVILPTVELVVYLINLWFD